MAEIKIYGADWCSLTTRAKAHLDQLQVPYEYVNIERDPQAAEWVRQQNDGKERKPTIDIQGQIFSEPSNRQLDEALRANGLIQ